MSTRVFLVCPHCRYELRPEHPDNQGPTAYGWCQICDRHVVKTRSAICNSALPQGFFQPAEHCGWIG
jgi:hypothetical protein